MPLLPILLAVGGALGLVVLIAYLDARAERIGYEQALDQLLAEERDRRFVERTTRRVDRANRNREGK